MAKKQHSTLPLYIIERVGTKWELYNTDTCECWQFDTREQAETKLKTFFNVTQCNAT